jgi:16S rRNA (cytosine1402-N4)-methyltransferase
MPNEYTHRPVLLRESIEALNIRPDGLYVDGTLGRAGHSREIAQRLTTGALVCVDRDQAALDAAQERLGPWMDRVTLIHGNFCDLAALLRERGITGADGMLFDLGVSSPQLDDPARGFSYMHDAPLDMRMDVSSPLSARDVVNTWSEEELRRILWEYGEERYAGRIAGAVVRARQTAPVETTFQLVDLIKGAMPAAALREKQHPAKRSFQAIRIAVNGELDALPPMLEGATELLHPGGRLAVITFHSLEDRIVKKTLQTLATGCICPPEFPVCVCGRKPKLRLLNRKPITAGEEELEENPRARSAKLRTAEKCDPFDLG